MSESKNWKWEYGLKTFTALGFLGTIAFGFYELKSNNNQQETERRIQKKENLKQRKFDLYKSFWEKRFESYAEVCNAAAMVTAKMGKLSRGEKPASAAGQKGFWVLYYGAITIVEDKAVEKAMFDFGETLRGAEVKVRGGEKPDKADMEKLKRHSLALALACRKSIGEYWEDLGQLDSVKLTEFSKEKKTLSGSGE